MIKMKEMGENTVVLRISSSAEAIGCSRLLLVLLLVSIPDMIVMNYL